MFYNRDIRRVH